MDLKNARIQGVTYLQLNTQIYVSIDRKRGN
jgi:hypothetical protein